MRLIFLPISEKLQNANQPRLRKNQSLNLTDLQVFVAFSVSNLPENKQLSKSRTAYSVMSV